MEKNLLLPISIIIGCAILGSCYLAGQIIKQKTFKQNEPIKVILETPNNLNISASVTNKEGRQYGF